MKTTIRLFLLFLLSWGSTADAVWGGESVRYNEAPYVFGFRGDLQCSATALNDRVLLTAAHCLEGSRSVRSLEFTRGANGSVSTYRDIRVADILLHPKYRIGFSSSPRTDEVQYDLALIILKDPLSESFSKVDSFPALAMTNVTAELEGLKFYGLGRYSRREVFGRKRKIEVSATYLSKLDIYKVKALKKNTGVCLGDSGGGLLRNNVITAVSSVRTEGVDCGSAENSAYMTPVGSHYCWIIKQIGKTDSQCEKRTL